MKVKATGRSHIGLKRKLNEDSYLVAPDMGLFMVADGMGGHKAGEVASRMVVKTMEDYWRNVNMGKPPTFLHPIREDLPEGARHLINSISFTNMIIHEAQKEPQYHRMGSTLSVLLLEGAIAWAANVGDSPIFFYDQGRMVLVSEEHSFEAEQRAMGISEPRAASNPLLKHMLTRAMGLNDRVDVHMTPLRPQAGDILLLCSDGLSNCVSEGAIKTVLGDFSISLERKVDILIDEANRGGGEDNVSVILLEIEDEGKWSRFKKRFTFNA